MLLLLLLWYFIIIIRLCSKNRFSGVVEMVVEHSDIRVYQH